MKTEANDRVHHTNYQADGGLTKREYFAASVGIQNEVADMLNKPNPDYLSLITGVKQPESELPTKDKDVIAWAKYWFLVEATLKVMKADALIEALNKSPQ